MAAARLADVGSRDLHPLVLGRRLDHPTQQLAVAPLELGALLQRHAGAGNAIGEGVAHPLELTEAGEPRTARRRDHTGVDLDARESLGRKARKLVLEPPDLAPQLGPGQTLVAAVDKPLVADP